MLEAKPGDRVTDARGLVLVERAGQSGAHIAEGAGAGAGVAHDHEGGVALVPALADIGTARLLADGRELEFAHQAQGLGEHRRAGSARTRIQGGLRATGWSGRCAFSGWRRLALARGSVRSMSRVMAGYVGSARGAVKHCVVNPALEAARARSLADNDPGPRQ